MGTTTSQPPDFLAELIARKQKELEAADAQARIDARSTGEQAGRDVRAFGTGLNDAIGNTVGAIPDAVGWGLRKMGLPSSAPDQYSSWARNALNSVGDTLSGGKLVPDTPAERNLYAAGEGTGHALSTIVPAAGVARAFGAGTQAARMSMTPWGTATSLQPGSAVGNVAGQIAANPSLQLAAGATGGSVGQATGSPLLGMAAGMGVPLGAGIFRGLVSPGLSQLNPEQTRLLDFLRTEGVPVTPGAASGSKGMRTTEAVLAELPFTGEIAAADKEAARVAFNKAALLRAGQTSEDYATPDVINATLRRAGQAIEHIYHNNDLNLDATTMQRVNGIIQHARADLGPEGVRPLEARWEHLISKIQATGSAPAGTAGARVPGTAYGPLDSDLTQAINATTGFTQLYMRNFRDALRSGFASGLPADQAEALEQARRHYANGIAIRASMNAGTAHTIAGNVPPAGLVRELAEGSGDKFAAGHGDLRDLAAAGKLFVTETTPNSGTTQRSFYQRLLTGGGVAGGVGAGAGYVTRDPLKAAAAGTAALGLPPIIQGLMRSGVGQRYLTNQAAARMPAAATGPMFGAAGTAQLPGILDPLPPDDPRVRRPGD